MLPVDEGGDSELRFFLAAEPPVRSFLKTPETGFADVEIDGYVAIGVTGSSGTRGASLLARAVGDTAGTLDAYGVSLTQSGSEANVSVTKVVNGINQSLASSQLFPVDLADENYRLYFRAYGSTLTAGVLRVEEIDGERVETPIDLDPAPGVQAELTAVDSDLTSGAIALRAFTTSTNSVFFDDVTVLDVVLRDGFESGDVTAWTASAP